MSKTTWRNRIVRTGWIDPAQLLANPRNYRIHPEFQQAALKGSLDEIGWYDELIVQDGTDVVIDGHARVALALRNGEPQVPVKWVDLDDNEANVVLATRDPISALAAFDTSQYRDLLDNLSTTEPALQELLAKVAEHEGIIPPDTFDPNAEWQGMPEYENETITGQYQVVVHFETADDLEEFERLIGQKIPDRKAKAFGIWFPKREPLALNGLRYTSDES